MKKNLLCLLFASAISPSAFSNTYNDKISYQNHVQYFTLNVNDCNDISPIKFLSKVDYSSKNAKLVTEVFHKTTYETLNDFLKGKGFVNVDMEPAFDDYGDLFTYESSEGILEIEYKKDKTILNVIFTYINHKENVTIEADLGKNGFKSESKNFKAGANLDQDFVKKIWSKSGSVNRFVTSVDATNDAGVIAYGILED